MSLFDKIQSKLKPEGTKLPSGSNPELAKLDDLPDDEKVKVLEYIASLKTLQSEESK